MAGRYVYLAKHKQEKLIGDSLGVRTRLTGQNKTQQTNKQTKRLSWRLRVSG